MNNIKIKKKRAKLISLNCHRSQSQESDNQSYEQDMQLGQQINKLEIELLPLYYQYTQKLSKLLNEYPTKQIQINLFQERLKLEEKKQKFNHFCEQKVKLQRQRDYKINLGSLLQKIKLNKRTPDQSLTEKILLAIAQQKELASCQKTRTANPNGSPLPTQRKPNNFNLYCQNCNRRKTQRNDLSVDNSENNREIRGYTCENKSLKQHNESSNNHFKEELNASPSFMNHGQQNQKRTKNLIPKQISNNSQISIKDHEGSEESGSITESEQNNRNTIFYSTKMYRLKDEQYNLHRRQSSVGSSNPHKYYRTLKKLINNQIEANSQKQERLNQNHSKNSKQKKKRSFPSQMNCPQISITSAEKRLLSQSYIDRQELKLESQKRKYESLHTEVSETLKTDHIYGQSNRLNSDIRQTEIFPEQQNAIEDKMIRNIKSLFIELLESIKFVQIYKYALQNKQFDIFSTIIRSNTFAMTNICIQDIEKGLDSFFKHKNNYLVIQKIFNNKKLIDFAQFSAAFKTNLTELEFKLLKPQKFNQSICHRLHTLILTLFEGWIEVDYFEKQIQAFFQKHATIYYNFMHQIGSECGSEVCLNKLSDFIYGKQDNENQMRTNRKNVEIFLRHYLKINTLEEFCCWAHEPHYLEFRRRD